MTVRPLVSVVIPTKNGESTLQRCLKSIENQTIKEIEVIAIDSGSTDNTTSIAKKFPFVRLLAIPPGSFNHGSTRNLGVQESKGKYVLMTVQDAYAYSEDWIEIMLRHFEQDREVAGVCGQQVVPHEEDKNPHEWFRPYSKPFPRVVHFPDVKEVKALPLPELHQFCGWDNVNAMYKKEILQQFPFHKLSFGEDMAWAKEVVLAGKKVVYDYRSRVYHYHHSTFDYTYRRTLTVLYNIYKNFGYLREVKFDVYAYLKVLYRNYRYKADFRWVIFNWRKMMAAYKAYKDVMKALEDSEDSLDAFHQKKCGIPPQGIQNIK